MLYTRLISITRLSTPLIVLPTCVTFIRILAIPLIIKSMVAQQWYLATIICIIAALTDFLDGMLARWLNAVTLFGAYLDPIADKLFILALYFSFAYLIGTTTCVLVPVWFFYVILFKELVQIVGAGILVFLRGFYVPKPRVLAKITTALHLFFIIGLCLTYSTGITLIPVYYGIDIVFVAVIATLLDYLFVGYTMLQKQKDL